MESLNSCNHPYTFLYTYDVCNLMERNKILKEYYYFFPDARKIDCISIVEINKFLQRLVIRITCELIHVRKGSIVYGRRVIYI